MCTWLVNRLSISIRRFIAMTNLKCTCEKALLSLAVQLSPLEHRCVVIEEFFMVEPLLQS